MIPLGKLTRFGEMNFQEWADDWWLEVDRKAPRVESGILSVIPMCLWVIKVNRLGRAYTYCETP